jgi:outer membrane protein OmpU
MKNLKKVGLTALAASLATVSVNAGELSVSGGASIGWTSIEKANSAGWYMNDKIVFSGSGDLDNGLGFSMSLSIDESDTAANTQTFEGRSITLTSDTLGSLTFQGRDGVGVTGAYDDRMPTVYEETWYAATASTDGPNVANSFYYSNATMEGVQLDVSYTPGGSGSSQNAGTLEYGIVVSAIDGLTIGAAMGEDQSARDSEVDNTMLYATYAMGPVTVGIQSNDSDSTVDADDEEFTAAAITYAVSDDLTIMAATSKIDSTDTAQDQEIDSFGLGYSMGSMSIALQTFDVDNNAGGVAANDSYRMNELNISFAF